MGKICWAVLEICTALHSLQKIQITPWDLVSAGTQDEITYTGIRSKRKQKRSHINCNKTKHYWKLSKISKSVIFFYPSAESACYSCIFFPLAGCRKIAISAGCIIWNLQTDKNQSSEDHILNMHLKMGQDTENVKTLLFKI